MRPVGHTRTLNLYNMIRDLISATRNKTKKLREIIILSANETNVTHKYFVLLTIKHTLHAQILREVTRQLSIRNRESNVLGKCRYMTAMRVELFHQPTLMHCFLYSLTICLLHYYPRHVSSINMPIFSSKNYIHTASGIFALPKRLHSILVESRLLCSQCTVQTFVVA